MPGIPIVGAPSASTATGPTLLTLRTALAREFMFHLETTVSTTATQGDLTRVVLANELRDDEDGYDMTGLMWLYARTGAQAGAGRRVVSSDAGHLGPFGGVTVSRPFAAAIASGTTIDATGPLPMQQVGMVKGLQECQLEGLARIRTRARLALTGNGTRSLSLAAYPWLTRYEQIMGLYDTLWDDDPATGELSPYGHRLVIDNVTRTLVTDYSYGSGETVYLDVIVRADRLVYDGSSWGYVTSLQNVTDSYQFAVDERWALQFGLWRAARYARLWLKTVRMDPDRKAALLDEVQERYRSAVDACSGIKMREFPKPPHERPDPMTQAPRDLEYVV